MKRWLIRDRVTLASVAVLAVGLGILGVATNLVLSQRLSQDASALLRERTESQLATIDTTGGRLRLRPFDDAALDRQSWAFSHGRAIERAGAPPELQRMANQLADVSRPTERNLGERTRLRATPVYAADGSRVGTVVVGTSLAPYEHSERIARIATVILSLLVIALGALVARRAVGAALRPVGSMAATAADWSEHDLGRRLGLGPPRDELTSLAATLDDMLGRIDAALRHEQRFSAEVAHELRTPLSGVRAEAELGLRAPGLPPAARSSLESILAACDRMASAIETLLMSARAPRARGSSDPTVAVRDVAAALRPAATAAGVEISLRDPDRPLRVGADQEQVAQALAPLLDNAISHATARVEVSTLAENGRVTIAVEDDGAGLPEERRETVFEPGTSTRGGAGLGLALSRRLARSCGGDVLAVAREPGARFELRLPGTLSP
jgi:two-component system, OmpR family, sensor kinase